MFTQSDVVEIEIPPETEVITEEAKNEEVNLDETSSVIRNWSSLINEDLDKLIPEYDCVSTTKEKEQTESEIQLELEGKLYCNPNKRFIKLTVRMNKKYVFSYLNSKN